MCLCAHMCTGVCAQGSDRSARRRARARRHDHMEASLRQRGTKIPSEREMKRSNLETIYFRNKYSSTLQGPLSLPLV